MLEFRKGAFHRRSSVAAYTIRISETRQIFVNETPQQEEDESSLLLRNTEVFDPLDTVKMDEWDDRDKEICGLHADKWDNHGEEMQVYSASTNNCGGRLEKKPRTGI